MPAQIQLTTIKNVCMCMKENKWMGKNSWWNEATCTVKVDVEELTCHYKLNSQLSGSNSIRNVSPVCAYACTHKMITIIIFLVWLHLFYKKYIHFKSILPAVIVLWYVNNIHISECGQGISNILFLVKTRFFLLKTTYIFLIFYSIASGNKKM